MNPPTLRVIPVDHRNMRAFYTRGILTPASLTRRYKTDALAESPGRLPAFPVSMAPALAALLADDEGITVMLELGADSLNEADSDSESDMRAVTGLLPITEVVAAHVRTDRELAEITSRDYRNLDPSAIPLLVTPGLFEGEHPDLGPCWSWLNSLPPAEPIDTPILEVRESLAGAVLVLLDGVPVREPLLVAATELASDVLAWPNADDAIECFIRLIRKVGLVSETREEVVALEAVVRAVIAQSGPEEPAPTEILSAIADSAADSGDSASAMSLIEYIGTVIRGEKPFQGFRNTEDHRALKALLLFLLRPTAEETKSWFDEEGNLGDEIRALALVLSGLSRRSAGTPTGQRGGPPFWACISNWLVGREQHMTRDMPVGELLLTHNGTTIRRWDTPVPSTRNKLLAACEPDDPDALRIADALGWDDCVQTYVAADAAEIKAVRGKVVVRVAGRVKLHHEVLAEPFQARLAAADDAQIDAIPETPKPRPQTRRRRKQTTK